MFVDPEVADMVLRALLLSCLGVCWIIVVVRVIGLRAFSKMTAFDFVVTVATGSLLAGASQATSWAEFGQPALAIATLLAFQYLVARIRKTSDRFEAVIQNQPALLMHDGVFIDTALAATRVAKSDVIAKLREANVLDFTEVRAVILETTGDISVMHGPSLAPGLLEGVQRYDSPAPTSAPEKFRAN